MSSDWATLCIKLQASDRGSLELQKLPHNSRFLPVPHLAVVLQDIPPTDTTLHKFRGGQLKVVFLNRRALASIIPGSERFYWNMLF